MLRNDHHQLYMRALTVKHDWQSTPGPKPALKRSAHEFNDSTTGNGCLFFLLFFRGPPKWFPLKPQKKKQVPSKTHPNNELDFLMGVGSFYIRIGGIALAGRIRLQG